MDFFFQKPESTKNKIVSNEKILRVIFQKKIIGGKISIKR